MDDDDNINWTKSLVDNANSINETKQHIIILRLYIMDKRCRIFGQYNQNQLGPQIILIRNYTVSSSKQQIVITPSVC